MAKPKAAPAAPVTREVTLRPKQLEAFQTVFAGIQQATAAYKEAQARFNLVGGLLADQLGVPVEAVKDINPNTGLVTIVEAA